MPPLFLQCLTPVIGITALLSVVVVSMHRWPTLWPETLLAVALRIESRLLAKLEQVRRWFRPQRGDSLDAVQLRIRQSRLQFGRWAAVPSNRLTLKVAIGSFVAAVIGLVGLFMPESSLWNRAAFPILAVAVAVFVLDTVSRRRRDLLEKQRIVREMGSRSNHVALDAARQVVEQNWHRDGSLAGVVFERANLQGLAMARAKLGGASFMYARLRDAELMFADLSNARMGSSDLRNANLSFSDLENAVLGLADLENASLGRCSLRSTHLEGANLRDAFLEHADLDGAHLEQAIYSAKTRWPEGFAPPAGAINWDTLSDTERDWFRQWRWYLG